MQHPILILDRDRDFAWRLATRLARAYRARGDERPIRAYDHSDPFSRAAASQPQPLLIYSPAQFADFQPDPRHAALRLHDEARLDELIFVDPLRPGTASSATTTQTGRAPRATQRAQLYRHAGLRAILSQLDQLQRAMTQVDAAVHCHGLLVLSDWPRVRREAMVERLLQAWAGEGRRLIHLPLLPAAEQQGALFPLYPAAERYSDLASLLERVAHERLAPREIWPYLQATRHAGLCFCASRLDLSQIATTAALETLVRLIRAAVEEAGEAAILLIQAAQTLSPALLGVAPHCDELVVLRRDAAAQDPELERLRAQLPAHARTRLFDLEQTDPEPQPADYRNQMVQGLCSLAETYGDGSA